MSYIFAQEMLLGFASKIEKCIIAILLKYVFIHYVKMMSMV